MAHTQHSQDKHFTLLKTILILLILLISVPSFAQTDDDRNFARGFEPDQYFHDFGQDNINALNGNLTISIPIGMKLEHNGELSFQLSLVYNSKIWAVEPKTFNEHFMKVPYLEGRSTVGLGWRLHVGRIYKQDMGSSTSDEVYFETQDGNIHRLYPTDLTNPNDDYWYTKDNSFIRAIFNEAVNPEDCSWTVWFPDGRVANLAYFIEHNEADYTSTGTSDGCDDDPMGYHDCFRGYYTTLIKDRYDNKIIVTYKEAPHYRCLDKIEFEGIGSTYPREITFDAASTYRFESGSLPVTIEGGYITDIYTPAFSAEGSLYQEAHYELHYYQDETSYPYQEVVNPYYSDDPTFFLCDCANSRANIMLLSGISLPEEYALEFTYNIFEYNDLLWTFGELVHMKNPMNSNNYYQYQTYNFESYYTQPKQGWTVAEAEHRKTRAVVGRTVMDRNDTSILSNVIYERAPQPGIYGTTNPEYVKICTSHPNETATTKKYYTHIDYYYSDVIPGHYYSRCDEGLPACETIYHENDSTSNCWIPTQPPNPNVEAKVTYHLYESDPVEVWGGADVYPNTREYTTETLWPKYGIGGVVSGYTWVRSAKSDYREFGHYRLETIGQKESQYQVFSTLRSIEKTWWIENDTSNTYYNKWFVNTLKTNIVFDSQGNESSWETYNYDTTYGTLTKVAYHRDENVTNDCVNILYTYEDTGSNKGNMIEEKRYLGLTPYFTIDYDYMHGKMYKKWHQEKIWSIELKEIHEACGLAQWTQDSAGVRIYCNYDKLGRLINVSPADTSVDETEIAYAHTTLMDYAELMRKDQGTGNPKITDKYIFNSRGAIYENNRDMPSGTSHQDRVFGPQGHTLDVSVPAYNTPGSLSEEIQYDVLGRMVEKITPDGFTTTISHSGLKSTESAEIESGQTRTRVITKDGLGRTILAEEKHEVFVGATWTHLGWFVTEYEYDGEDRLLSVGQYHKTALGAVDEEVQERLYSYDLQGNLISSSEPENGNMNYYAYNPNNDVGVVEYGDGDRLLYVYDSIGRLQFVKFRPDGEVFYRRLTEYGYDHDYSESDDSSCTGRLSSVEEYPYEYASNGNRRYREEYVYAGKSGSLSRMNMFIKIASGKEYGWKVIYKMNSNGKLKNIDYPDPKKNSTEWYFTPKGNQYRDIVAIRDHSKGLITGIEGGGASILETVAYHPTTSIETIEYGNDINSEKTIDAQGRIANIKFIFNETIPPVYESGTYEYDGLSEIKSIGGILGDIFQYDSLSRLKKCKLDNQSYVVSYDYDSAGNMTDRTLDNGAILGYPSFTNTYYTQGGYIRNKISMLGYTYDAKGNLTKYTTPASNPTVTNYMQYDGKNRLVGYANQQEAADYEYLYDHRGRRVLKIDTVNEEYTYYLRDYFSGQVLSEYSSDLIYTPWWTKNNIYMGRALVCSEKTLDEGISNFTWERRYYNHDHLDTPIYVFDEDGTIQKTNRYTPFGVEIPPFVNDDYEGSHRFTGHERDEESKLDYMFKRYYTQHLCRFLSTDLVGGEVGSSQSWNKYLYCSNDPVGRLDPDGRADYRTDKERMMLESPKVLATIGKMVHVSNLASPKMSSRRETSAVIVDAGSGSYETRQFMAAGSRKEVPMGKVTNGTLVSTGESAAGTVHTHTGVEYFMEAGGPIQQRGAAESSNADQAIANEGGVASYILNVLTSMFKYDPATDEDSDVLTEGDFNAYLQRAAEAYEAEVEEITDDE